jgi:CRISPR-associated protein Cas1
MPNIRLYCDKGFLFCKFDDESEKKIPIDDLRAIIVATHQVSFSNSCLATLLEKDVVILHCNNFYKPVGWSIGFDRIVRTKPFFNQLSQNEDFNLKLWKAILKQKVNNQASNLDLCGVSEHTLHKLINRPLISEGNIAKQYWKNYFKLLDEDTKREHKDAQNFANICLNYGYAVFSTLIYRAILIHGLSPNIGIHHKEKYDSTPFIYDLIEPFRAFVDFYLVKFKINESGSYKQHDRKAWARYLAFCMKNYRLKSKGLSYKLLDFVDIFVEDIAKAYENFDPEYITYPDITQQYLHIDKQRNREYEE